MPLYKAKITWRVADATPALYPYYTEARVAAPDELTAKRIIESDLPKQLSGFRTPPSVRIDKLELELAASNLLLVNGYGS